MEVGGFGRFTRFDRSLQLESAFGGGGRLGVFLTRAVSVEVAGSYLPTSGPVNPNHALIPWHARLIYGAPIGDQVSLVLGVGYLHTVYGSGGKIWDDGVSGLIGVRFGLDQTFTFRLEAIGDFIPSPANHSASISNNWNFALQAGLSAWLGSSRPKDSLSRDSLPKDPLPKDADSDAVVDGLDRCPNTPRGQRVDAAGCPLDSDRDGVLDSADQCPNTPGRSASGCPPAPANDSDGDGVVDSADKCSGTGTGERVDAIGCPALFQGTQRSIVLEGVSFGPGSTTLTAPARASLDRVVESLVAHPGLRVEVAGHTDNFGSNAAKMAHSWARAEAVRRYLIDRGVSPEVVTARGFGGSQPIDTNSTPDGRARNRRVELRRLN